jgi:hypothetical protein
MHSLSNFKIIPILPQPTSPYVFFLLCLLSQLLCTYMDPLVKAATPEGGESSCARIFNSWNQAATGTGRLSSSSPNLQALPRSEAVTLNASGVVGRLDACDGAAGVDGVEGAWQQLSSFVNIRTAFFSGSRSSVLLSADFNQVGDGVGNELLSLLSLFPPFSPLLTTTL